MATGVTLVGKRTVTSSGIWLGSGGAGTGLFIGLGGGYKCLLYDRLWIYLWFFGAGFTYLLFYFTMKILKYNKVLLLPCHLSIL